MNFNFAWKSKGHKHGKIKERIGAKNSEDKGSERMIILKRKGDDEHEAKQANKIHKVSILDLSLPTTSFRDFRN